MSRYLYINLVKARKSQSDKPHDSRLPSDDGTISLTATSLAFRELLYRTAFETDHLIFCTVNMNRFKSCRK